MSADGVHVSRGELITAVLGGWIVVGAGLDAWTHVSRPEVESFFTPAHAVLYSGFVVTASQMLREWRRTRSSSVRAGGWGVTLAGLGSFAIGGIGDLIWHSAFGVEREVGAVTSPPHVLLILGAALVLSAPLRRAWSREVSGWRPMIAPFLSAVSLISLASLVFFFLSPFVRVEAGGTLETHRVFIGGPPGEVQRGIVGSILMTDLILFGFLLALVQRWKLPPGSVTVSLFLPLVIVMAVGSFEPVSLLAVAASGAVVVEGLHTWLEPGDDRRRFLVFGVLAPGAFWSTYVILVPILTDVSLQADLAWGAVVWSALGGLGIAAILWRSMAPVR